MKCKKEKKSYKNDYGIFFKTSEGHLFSLLYDMFSTYTINFTELFITEIIICTRFLLLLFVPWVDHAYKYEEIGKGLKKIANFLSFIPLTSNYYTLFILFFYIFFSLYMLIAIGLVLAYFLRAYKTHIVYDFILHTIQYFFKFIFYPSYITLFGILSIIL